MTRNLDYRVNATCPIYDPGHKAFLRELFDIQWWDNVKACSLTYKKINTVVEQQRKRKVRSQNAIARFAAKQTQQNSTPRAWHHKSQDLT